MERGQSPPAPSSRCSGAPGPANKNNVPRFKNLVYKGYKVYIEDRGDLYWLWITRADGDSLPTFILRKDKLDKLFEYTRIEPPNNLDPELAEYIYGVLKDQAQQPPIPVETPAPEAVQSIPEEAKLPEEIEDLYGLLEEEKNPPLPLVASMIVDKVIETYRVRTPVINDRVLGIYCYEHGAYVECEEKLEKILKEYYDMYALEERGIKYRSLRAEFLAQLEDSTKTFQGFRHDLVLFKNKVVDWRALVYGDKLEIIDPSPELMIFHRIPWEIDVETLSKGLNSSREELVKGLEGELNEITDIFKQWVGDKWQLLYEIIGYTLLAGEFPLNKAIMLVGEGRNGKSTYLELIKRLLGSDNVASVKLQDLTDQAMRFSIAQLYGKMANIFADLPSEALRYTGVFKILTGEDSVTADRKFRDPITFKNYAKMIFSCNELPRVYDMTQAFWRRWIVIEFPNQFPPDEGFKRRLYNDLLPRYASKILAYSLLLIKHVIKSGKFSYEESEADYKELWLRETNTVYAFLQDALREGVLLKDKNAREETSKIYQLYIDYCNREERQPLDKSRFSMEMQRQGYPRVKVKGHYYYKGLRILSEKWPEEPGPEEPAQPFPRNDA